MNFASKWDSKLYPLNTLMYLVGFKLRVTTTRIEFPSRSQIYIQFPLRVVDVCEVVQWEEIRECSMVQSFVVVNTT